MATSPTNDNIQLTIPLKAEYLPVLRATVGVIAGVLAFNYDEIMQLRVAVSEVFNLAMGQLREQPPAEVPELAVSISAQPDGLEILLTSPSGFLPVLDGLADDESLALLNSLLDKVEMSHGKAGVRMVKYKTGRE